MASRSPPVAKLSILLLVAAILGAVGLAMWRPSAPAPEGNLAGATIGGDFALVDENERPVSSATFANQWRLMYFGFTHCPDICPTDLAQLGQGLAAFERRHPHRASRVQPLFVTVDPSRDTPDALRAFTEHFHPRLIGLTGSEAQVAQALATFRVYAVRAEGATEGSYLMDHSTMVYLFDPEGAPVAFVARPRAESADVEAMLDAHVR